MPSRMPIMSKAVPIIAGILPTQVTLEKGKDYFWCQCGRSKSQPFCDGSHAGTGIGPLRFTAERDGDTALCLCKSTANGPFCDGSHTRLGAAKVGDAAPTPKSGVPQATATPEEPTVARIHALATDGLSKLGHHGEMGSMGVPRKDLPHWDDIQILPAQMARKPLLDDVPVSTTVTIGPRAARPLQLAIPLFVSDMSFGALSEEAKTALARGAQMAGTGICSGEGGMLPEEQAENSRYFYELASARFGWSLDHVARVQAFHFKGVQGAKQAPAAICQGKRCKARSPRCAGWSRGRPRFRPPHSPTCILQPSSGGWRMRCASALVAFQSGSNCRPTISRMTSTLPWRPAPTTSS